jgi:urease gamma subunit
LDPAAERQVQLTPREIERLLIFTAAELARRRLADRILLSHPDCIALAADAVLEAARRGATHAEAQACARGLVRADQLLPGVPDLLEAPGQVEASFPDGSRLVTLDRIVAT